MPGKGILPAVIIVLLIGLCVTQVMLFARIQKLETMKSAEQPPQPPPGAVMELDEPEPPKTGQMEPEPEPPVPPMPRPSAPPTPREIVRPEKEQNSNPDPAMPATRQQLEDMVRRLIKEEDEKNGMSIRIPNMEDPLEVMKREMNLTPAQALRIKEIRDGYLQAVDELMGSDRMMSDQQGWSDDFQALTKDYHEQVKSELDYNQKQKYDELRRSGKLMDAFTRTSETPDGKRSTMRVVGGGVDEDEEE
ncbi:MAG: hypothetical protein ACYTAF_13085 [Planctomycetota bacterium]|jgi:hypothetical protein